MQINQPLKDCIREFSRLTGSSWVAIAFREEEKWCLAEGSFLPPHSPRLLSLTGSDKFINTLNASVKRHQIYPFSGETANGPGVGRFYVVPINDTAVFLIGTDSMEPRTKRTWKAISAVAEVHRPF